MITYQVAILNNSYPTFSEFRETVVSDMETWLQDNMEGRFKYITLNKEEYGKHEYVGIDFKLFADALAFTLMFSHGLAPGIWEYENDGAPPIPPVSSLKYFD